MPDDPLAVVVDVELVLLVVVEMNVVGLEVVVVTGLEVVVAVVVIAPCTRNPVNDVRLPSISHPEKTHSIESTYVNT